MITFIVKKIFLISIVLGLGQSLSFAQSCNFNGLSIPHGQTVTGYKYNSINYGLNYDCNTILSGYESFQCQNGYLTGLNGGHFSRYPYLSCSNNPPLNCIAGSIFGQQIMIPHYMPNGYPTINNVGVFVFPIYKQDLVESSISCNMPIDYNLLNPGDNGTFVYCKNGILYNIYGGGIILDTNIYKHTICNNRPPRDCQLGNTTIKHNQNITTFDKDDSRNGGSCNSEIRTCNDGTLSGSFSFLTCQSYSGICGSSHSNYFQDQPSKNLCAAGTPGMISYNTVLKQWNRSCLGDGGGDSNCSAYWTGNVSRGVCNEFPDGASFLSSTNEGLCEVGITSNFQSSIYGWTWKCITGIGSSDTCEAKKGVFPEANIVYSTTSPTNNNVTAYVVDMKPYGTVIQNNDSQTSKVFERNGSFTFILHFNNKTTYLTAEVNWINNRPITLADLAFDYQANKCKAYPPVQLPSSKSYNLLDMQTMINNCIFKDNVKNGKINISKNKALTRKEFIKSLYYFITTIRNYDETPTIRNEGISYKRLPKDKDMKYIVGRFTTIGGRDYVQHNLNGKSLTTNRNGAITPKEVYETISYVLTLHEDSISHWQTVWNKNTNILSKKSLSYHTYASLMRQLLEVYDRVPIGNNDSLIYNIYQRIKDLSIDNQKTTINKITLGLHQLNSKEAEQQGISIRRMLDDISSVYNNTIPKRKGVIKISLEKVKERIGINKSKITTNNLLKIDTNSLFNGMSF